MCLTSGVTPAFSASATASAKTASWAAIDGCPGMSAQAKWDHRPVTWTEPRAWAASAAVDHGGPVGRGGAAPAQPGVGLEVQPGPDAGPDRRGLDLRDERGRGGRDVHAVADRLAGVAEGHQAQHRRGDARLPERDRLGQVGDAQPGRPAGQRRPGGRDHAVAVPVGLHHGHHLAAADQLAQGRDVAGDRAEVDEGFPVHAVLSMAVITGS